MTKKINTLPQRLKSKQLIDHLFTGKDSKYVTAFPIRAIVAPADSLQLIFSVSKRHFKHAVDRNRTKRQMREAFRLNQSLLTDSNKHIAFVWLADQLVPTPRVESAMVKILTKLSHNDAVTDI